MYREDIAKKLEQIRIDDLKNRLEPNGDGTLVHRCQILPTIRRYRKGGTVTYVKEVDGLWCEGCKQWLDCGDQSAFWKLTAQLYNG